MFWIRQVHLPEDISHPMRVSGAVRSCSSQELQTQIAGLPMTVFVFVFLDLSQRLRDSTRSSLLTWNLKKLPFLRDLSSPHPSWMLLAKLLSLEKAFSPIAPTSSWVMTRPYGEQMYPNTPGWCIMAFTQRWMSSTSQVLLVSSTTLLYIQAAGLQISGFNMKECHHFPSVNTVLC